MACQGVDSRRNRGEGVRMADCFNVVDLFCGAGGMSYGFELYNDSNGNRFRIISGLDHHPYTSQQEERL